jgi:hypothetical protein
MLPRILRLRMFSSFEIEACNQSYQVPFAMGNPHVA